jgi:hypothetical protein
MYVMVGVWMLVLVKEISYEKNVELVVSSLSG